MNPTDVTVQILGEIRDAIQGTNARLDRTRVDLTQAIHETNSRIDQTNSRIDQTNSRLGSLENRVVESEIRLATAVTALAGDLGEVKTLLRERADLRVRIERCEEDIAELKQQPGRK